MSGSRGRPLAPDLGGRRLATMSERVEDRPGPDAVDSRNQHRPPIGLTRDEQSTSGSAQSIPVLA